MIVHAVDVVLLGAIRHDLVLRLDVLKEFEDEPGGDVVALAPTMVGQLLTPLPEVGTYTALDERPDHQADAVGESQGGNAVRGLQVDRVECCS